MTPTVEQTVYLLEFTRSYSKETEPKIIEGTLKTIGRKYYTVNAEYCDYRFDKQTLEEAAQYSPYRRLYFNKQGIFDRCEKERLFRLLRKELDWCNCECLSLNKLRRIKAILDEPEERVN